MALLDKIMVWKKKEPLPSLDTLGKEEPFGNLRDTDIGAGIAPPFGSEPMGEPSFAPEPSFPQRTPYPGAPTTPQFAQPMGRDMELVSSKLDTIKALLDNINQRLTNLERIAKEGI